LLYWL